MYKYFCLNPISPVGLEKFSDDYVPAGEMAGADAVLVRSAGMHELEFDKDLKAIARAGAGVNNIPLDKCAEQGIVVFNTPGANANGVKELVIAGMLLASRDILGGINWVQENEEDGNIAKDAEKASLSMHFTSYETTDENKKYLRNLPKEAIFTFNNKTIRFVHGSTRVINEYLKENSKEAEEVMNELVEDILVCGHTHIPYAKYYGEKLLVNAGSVGKPKTNKPDANYVIIEICDTNVEVEIIEVSYNFEKMAKEIEENEILPNDFARLIREGSAK